MLRIFFGEDRVTAAAMIKKILGEDYEVFEGADLTVGDLPSLFLGVSLFGEKRRILIRDLSMNKEVFEKVADYAKTEHEVIIFELKLDKRSAAYKNLAASGIEMKEFAAPKKINANLVFDIFDVALKDGAKAVKMLEKIEDEQDPFMFFGLMVSQALKKFAYRQGEKEKRVLKELSKLDLEMKTTSIQPWLLVKSFLLRLSQV